MYHCKEAYRGEKTEDGKRMHNRGQFNFANGNSYQGMFDDGRFHGEGVLHFTMANGGGQYRSLWRKGECEKGDYIFADGLEYSLHDWNYCTQQDRRLWKEHLTFITPPVIDGADPKDTIYPNYGSVDPVDHITLNRTIRRGDGAVQPSQFERPPTVIVDRDPASGVAAYVSR
eukprot:TRINITY_DN1126_c4_g1_i1.p1 TRINITY_DN1126_c4_g1~~TRINITY_DN1126_c4_g1_i1.p1  ORF type:complete len:172 (+),score=58.70 TRINITY_DN1126_c4_g1_i1:78-593(+)